MRRTVTALGTVLLVGSLSLAGDLPGWSTDGTTSYSSAVVIQNVSDTVAVVNIAYPAATDHQMTVPAGTSHTQYVNDGSGGPWGVAALVTSDVPIVATQNFLTWDPNGGTQWASHSGGVASPSKTWYLAEGCTYGGFQSILTIRNPNEQPAEVGVTYTVPGAHVSGPSVSVCPYGQRQIVVSDTVADCSSIGAIVTSDVPVIAQLTTYWNGGAASTSTMGAPSAATTWYLAEGNTASWSGFETWITVQNPTSDPAEVHVQFIGDGVKQTGPTFTVAPVSQDVFNAADYFPEHTHFATVVTASSPILAVQSKRWESEQGYDGTMGVNTPSSQWYFPSAQSHLEASSWIAVQNVEDTSTTVTIDYVTEHGSLDRQTVSLDPFAHQTISLPDEIAGQTPIAVVVNSAQPILAQQGQCWETGSGTYHDTMFGATAPSTIWYLPATPQAQSQLGPFGTAGGATAGDRDGDGVPDDEDFCPDYPGSAEMNGC